VRPKAVVVEAMEEAVAPTAVVAPAVEVATEEAVEAVMAAAVEAVMAAAVAVEVAMAVAVAAAVTEEEVAAVLPAEAAAWAKIWVKGWPILITTKWLIWFLLKKTFIWNIRMSRNGPMKMRIRGAPANPLWYEAPMSPNQSLPLKKHPCQNTFCRKC
jgi:hypothetical protein